MIWPETSSTILGLIFLIGTTLIGLMVKIVTSMNNTNCLLQKFLMEHEILMQDYCERKDITLEQLPTRLKGLKL